MCNAIFDAPFVVEAFPCIRKSMLSMIFARGAQIAAGWSFELVVVVDYYQLSPGISTPEALTQNKELPPITK
jgi:hypothetical protein